MLWNENMIEISKGTKFNLSKQTFTIGVFLFLVIFGR